MFSIYKRSVHGENVPFRHIAAEYRVSASPLTRPFGGGGGGEGVAFHPLFARRPFRCTGRFVLRFFPPAAALQSVPTQPVATPP